MRGALEFMLNGRAVRVENCSPNLTLLEYLRGIRCTGSKEGCAEGDCGACSVAIRDRDVHGKSCFRAINSCLVPLALLAGREIISVEGVAAPGGELHPVQSAMVQCQGSQCGYCTPGFIMALFEGYYRDDLKTGRQWDEQLCGNLCRCTGYRPIREAASVALAEKNSANGPRIEDRFVMQLQQPFSELGGVDYETEGERFLRPTNLPELFEQLREHPGGKMIAGATELGLEISKRFKKFAALISLEAVKELKEFKITPAAYHVGAGLNLTQVEELLTEEFPAFVAMLRVFGSRQIRNRATLGGNLVTASPIGDSAPALLALEAALVLISSTGERVLPLEEFFVAYRKTALQPGEVLRSVIIPRAKLAAGTVRHGKWYKVSKRREMDISTVAAAFTVDVDAAGIVQHARLAYGGVAAMPARARKTEASFLGKPWNAETILDVLPILKAEFTPISDVRGDATYRQGLIASLLEKFFEETTAKTISEIKSPDLPQVEKRAARPLPHESAHKHVTGAAIYTDDQAAGRRMLETWPVCSPHARARILKRDATAARRMPGIAAVLLAEDIPGKNDVGAVKHDEILLATDEISFHGQIVALVVGETAAACRAAAASVLIEYEPLTPLLSLAEAVTAGSFHNEPNYIRRGDVLAGLSAAPLHLAGEFELGGQEHFYLETHAAWAEGGEDGSIIVTSSTQHPSEVQHVVAHVLHLPMNRVIVQSPRMGGGFGGKETQANTPAALAALAATKTGRAVRVRFNRDQDMALSGHRHPFLAKFEAGFDTAGKLLALKAHLFSNGGWALDLSQAVTDRALFHLDNAYYIPQVEFRGQVAKLNVSSNTAFRGFGGPQGMLVIEEIIDRIARQLGLPPEQVRERNLYDGRGETNTTHYGQELEDNRIPQLWHELKTTSGLEKRRAEIAGWNAQNPFRKRGLAMTPVKFGISFTVTHLNQAGAFILLYQDGTIQVNHGGTEMGQGLHTNLQMIAARELGIEPAQVRMMQTSTDKVPNTSATAASAGTDLNGAAVKNACDIMRERLRPIAVEALLEKNKTAPQPENVIFADGGVRDSLLPDTLVPFFEIVQRAYFQRLSLSTTGYYRTPNIHWDRVQGRGKPFHYFAYGAAVAEVEVDGFTGMLQVLRVDVLHDVGDSINPGINRGQIEGGFVQGMGWLTGEELKWDEAGRLLTHSPDTYKIPAVGDMPQIFNVNFLKNAAQPGVVYGSKAVGEPPLMLAISVREAIRDAVAAFGETGGLVELASPATSEAVFKAIQRRLKQ